ncbi:hypothetical protein Sste5346_008722 [Sporothrix stenoceras]|uniref:Alpha/beta hydrolase fold-3 domain-containing protein n=1 Tax=Sporothrix stenoceras TaxID=5173 RepID=A0ABR3YPD3_9PEZI
MAAIDPEVLPKLDPNFVKFFQDTSGVHVATHKVSLDEIRKDPHKFASRWSLNAVEKGIERVQDLQIPTKDGAEITIRVYSPDPKTAGPGPHPVHVNFHGGGFVFGDLTNDAEYCLHVRDTLPLVVVDVDYRKCPDVKFGTSIKDAWDAIKWVHANASQINTRPDSLSIGGISAGAQCATICAHLARDAGLLLKLAILAVPPGDMHFRYKSASESPYPSFSEFANAPMLGWERIQYFIPHVYPENEREELLRTVPAYWFKPVDAPNFAGLCPTFVVTAGCDPLRDEGEAYARKLVEAGVRVTTRRYLGVPHPFMHMTKVLQQAVDYEADCVALLKQAHDL